MRVSRSSSMLAIGLSVVSFCGAARGATVENVTYSLGKLRLVIPRIETSGGAMTDADLKGLTDAASPDTLAQRLSRLDATVVTIPELRVEATQGGSRRLLTYRDIRLNQVAAGTADSLDIGSAVEDTPEPAGQVTYGAIKVRKLNLALAGRILTTARTDPNEPMQTLFESFTTESLKMSSAETDVTTGRMTQGGLKVRALQMPLAQAGLLAPAAEHGALSPEEKRKFASLMADVLHSIDMGPSEVRDLKLTAKGDLPATVSIGRVSGGAIAKAMIGEVAAEDIRIAMPDGRMSLSRIAFRDLDLSRTLSAIQQATPGGDGELTAADSRKAMPSLGALEIAGVQADLADKTGTGNSPDGKRLQMTLGRFEFGMRNFVAGVPTALFATVQNLAFPVPKHPKDSNLQQIAELGLDKVDLSSGLDIAWDEPAQEIGIEDLSVSMPGLGALKIKGRLGNATKDLFSSNLAMAQASALGLVAKSLDLRLDNAGGVQKAMALQAKRAGQTTQQVQQMLIAGAAFVIPAVLGDHPAARVVANAVTKFLAEPKSLSIAAQAPAGVGVADVVGVSNPQQILQKLEVRAEANK